MLDIKRIRISDTFSTETGSWLVTDVGSRVVVAIKIVDKDWMTGPPYAVEEVVFDENDFPVCHVDDRDDTDLGLSSDQSASGDFDLSPASSDGHEGLGFEIGDPDEDASDDDFRDLGEPGSP